MVVDVWSVIGSPKAGWHRRSVIVLPLEISSWCLPGDMADLPANLRDALLGRKGEADQADADLLEALGEGEGEGQHEGNEVVEEAPPEDEDEQPRTPTGTPTPPATGKRAASASSSSGPRKKPAAKA